MNPLLGLVLITAINLLLSNSKTFAQNSSATPNNKAETINTTIEQINKEAQQAYQAYKEKNYRVALTYYLRAANINPTFTTKTATT